MVPVSAPPCVGHKRFEHPSYNQLIYPNINQSIRRSPSKLIQIKSLEENCYNFMSLRNQLVASTAKKYMIQVSVLYHDDTRYKGHRKKYLEFNFIIFQFKSLKRKVVVVFKCI